MILRYCPPFIFAHRCYVERGENEISAATIKAKFGDGGNMPDTEHRWLRGHTGPLDLKKMGIDRETAGVYYGFRTRDDQVLFYMLFEGQMRKR